MRNFICTFCVVACFSTIATGQHLYVVGVPSEMDAVTGDRVLNGILGLTLRVNEGDRIQVFDALNLQRVTDMTIPSIPGKLNLKVRVVRLKKEIAALKTYFKRSASVRSGKPTEIKVPQFFELAGSAIKSSSGDTTVVVFGSPYYLETRDAAFVFGHGYYPSDGHILTSSKRSVFGTSDKRNLLKGATVHFCHLSDVFETELERTAVRRFWKVYCEGLGAVLATFVPSIEVAVERGLNNVNDAVSQDHLNANDTVIEMRKTVVNLNRELATVEADNRNTLDLESTPPTPDPSLPVEPLIVDRRVETVLRSVPKPKSGSILIAAVWVARGNARTADVDLYFRPNRGAEELNFRNRFSPEGKYLRDIRTAKNSLNDDTWGASLEAVEINVAHVENATCWLNLYSGGGEIKGIVRIVYDERTADVTFTFPAIAGDKAVGRTNRAGNMCWIKIALDELHWTRAG